MPGTLRYSAELLAELDRVESALELAEVERRSAHGALLRDVLRLHAVMTAGGDVFGCAAQLALLRGTSELASGQLLEQALLLGMLPGALPALDCGLLSVEQAAQLTRSLRDACAPVALTVWAQLKQRLITADARRELLPPGRLRTLVDGWLVKADPESAAERRERAQEQGDVGYRRREDGLVDLYLSGLTGPNAHAILSRIRARSGPWGAGDERPAGQRRLQAAVDLLLGRDHGPVVGQAAPCGCRPGQPAPCGADVRLLVPLGAATGATDELAQLLGHGPLDPVELHQILAAAPVLRPAWVDDEGVPVAESPTAVRPGRDDPAALRRVLADLAAHPPPPPQPRHPDDHPPPSVSSSWAQATDAHPPDAHPPVGSRHPCGAPGNYRIPAAVRRLVELRSPRCEWPGCGCASVRCDIDHDVAWPAGATCACQLGPLCRRHHRLKQLVLAKRRGPQGVLWTDRTGRTWLSPPQHARPEPPRPQPDPSPPRQLPAPVLAQLPAWVRAVDRTSDEGRQLLRHAVALLDPELSLSPDQVSEELLDADGGRWRPEDPRDQSATSTSMTTEATPS